MENRISLKARKELLAQIRKRYRESCWKEKGKILDGFIAATGYERKYAIGLFGKTKAPASKKARRKCSYGQEVYQALLTVWKAANCICSKRLAPFLPELVRILEKHEHLSLPSAVRLQLLSISPATMDRLLLPDRQEQHRGISTTKPGSLLKKQIKVRTFAGWNDVVPGFIEADLVAHCGTSVGGAFLNTLVMTDIASGWTEFAPLIRKGEAQVIEALEALQKLLPFILLGLDTDNGSEFINYGLLKFCEKQHITFTRSRAYRKNDQAHVEEKNGSIVRKLIGYDRYEGDDSWRALADVYAAVRLYVNFFQPSMKLISKERQGAKTHKSYDQAQTPYQRLQASAHVSQEIKTKLICQYETLDPVTLLQNMEELHGKFWQYAWKDKGTELVQTSTDKPTSSMLLLTKAPRQYRRTPKPRKPFGPRTWRTREDPFENVWDGLQVRLAVDPRCTPTKLLKQLIKQEPEVYSMKHLRTLQRRIAKWRDSHTKYQDQSYFLSAASSASNVVSANCTSKEAARQTYL